MLSFMDVYTLWRAQPFPRGGSGGELSAIHGDLAVADEHVTAVIRFVERGVFKPVTPGVLPMLDDILERTERLLVDADASVRAVAQQQHAYAALLRLLYAQFLAAGAG